MTPNFYYRSNNNNNDKGVSSPSYYTNTYKLSKLPEETLDWIEDNGFDLITICDSMGKIIYISQSVKKILGYEPELLIGKFIKEYVAPNEYKIIVSKIEKYRNYSQKFTLSIRDYIGKYIWVETAMKKIENNDDKDIFILLTKDITDKKEAEEMLIRSEKMSVAGQLAAGVAHEIRNPLTSLKGFIQLLQSGIKRKDEYYKIMIDEIDKIDTITSELLFISKPMTDEKKLEKLSIMLNDVITLLRSQAKLFNIEISLCMDQDQLIYCDRTQIKQVLINLLKNAIEEMKDGGTIEVVLTNNEDYCSISIIDEGPGIPEHILHKLKEPFFTTKKDGTGLGLMISYKIIENHQGNIEIHQNEDKGSTFKINLPVYST
ncbi:ATP-binding protein [Aquibacillus rhizosphaerae]|uniref:histidine kinase n=1 Tax=Aquibacillus rhizosphaerae TaxID=3051431 RepID=A0ABT7L138_9BACI|nr:ATP-binding protein [Aquibacillus sp. LR5S19]MDL4839543.1 ATP-binding protein [Aquibacillus sp. LR5S19]